MFLEQERELNIFWDNTKKALTKKKKHKKQTIQIVNLCWITSENL
jgi:hypothetical protein